MDRFKGIIDKQKEWKKSYNTLMKTVTTDHFPYNEEVNENTKWILVTEEITLEDLKKLDIKDKE